MMVKIFYPNEKGKVEFSKEELEALLNEVYESGRSDAFSKTITWTSPTITPTWDNYTKITCNTLTTNGK